MPKIQPTPTRASACSPSCWRRSTDADRQQGSLDGLCGVYAIINAVDLVIGIEPRSKLPKELFVQLTHGLGAAALLRATDDGLDVFELERAATLALRWLSDTHGIELQVERPFADSPPQDTADYLKRLKKTVSTPGTAAVFSFKTSHMNHWTLATQVVGRTVMVRDSDRLRQLKADDFQLEEGRSFFRAADTLAVGIGSDRDPPLD